MGIKATLTILNLLFFVFLYGQDFGIISDKDGFANIRENPNIHSKIIDKLSNGHLVSVFSGEGNWLNIDYSINNQILKNGNIYKDRVKMVSEFKKVPKISENANNLILADKKFKIKIALKKFEKNNHSYKYVKDNPDQILLIDKRQYFGKDGGIPTIEYQKIEMEIGNEIIKLPKVALHNLYEPNLHSTEANYDEKNKILYISAMNSDGAGGYLVIWKIENGIYKERFIAYGF